MAQSDVKPTLHTWDDPIFQQECAEMQKKVDDLRGRTEEEYKDLLGRKGQFKTVDGQWVTPQSILIPISGKNLDYVHIDYVHIDDGTPQENKSFGRRLKEILKNKWDHHCPESLIVLLMLAVLILMAIPGAFEIMKIIGMGVYLLACVALVLWVVKVWTWDVIKQLLKK